MRAIDEIVPTLLRANEDDETSDTALEGPQNMDKMIAMQTPKTLYLISMEETIDIMSKESVFQPKVFLNVPE